MVVLRGGCDGLAGLVVDGVGGAVELMAELGEVAGDGGCVGEAAPAA
nr:hypothetical protein [Rhabdothermincola sediminis]